MLKQLHLPEFRFLSNAILANKRAMSTTSRTGTAISGGMWDNLSIDNDFWAPRFGVNENPGYWFVMQK